jgi:integrase
MIVKISRTLSTMKNLTLFKSTYHSKNTFQLFENKTGKEIIIFNAFCKDDVFIDLRYETKRRYATVISNYIDLIFEYNNLNLKFDYIEISTILKIYPIIYIKGCEIEADETYSDEWKYEKNIAKKLIIAAKNLSIKPHSRNSAINFKAAMNLFLKYCANTFENSELWTNEINSQTIEDLKKFNAKVLKSIHISGYKKEKLFAASWFGAVYHKTSKGITLTRGAYKNYKTRQAEQVNYFPFEHLQALFNSALNLRDKLIWMLMFGTGIRESEALRIEINHIDFKNFNIYIYDQSNSRFSKDKNIRFKGRRYSEIVFIPFIKKEFFLNLFTYFKNEYGFNMNHPYIFTILKGKNKGAPYFETTDYSRIKSFKRALDRANIDLNKPDMLNKTNTNPTPHSLRHSYAVFMKNFIKTKNGYGLDLDEVQQLMGHKKIESTSKYAFNEQLKLLNTLNNAFNKRKIDSKNTQETLNNTINEYLMNEASK